MSAAAMTPDDGHTWTKDELAAQLRNTRRRRARTDAVVGRSVELTERLAEVQPDHVIERLRTIIRGG